MLKLGFHKMIYRILCTATERGKARGTNLGKHGISFLVHPRKIGEDILATMKEIAGIQPHQENEARQQILAQLKQQGIVPGEPIDYQTQEMAERVAGALRKRFPHIDYEVIQNPMRH